MIYITDGMINQIKKKETLNVNELALLEIACQLADLNKTLKAKWK